jgi:hypothetical protein
MTILRITKRDVNREMYDAINARVDIDRRHPLGLIVHGATAQRRDKPDRKTTARARA